MASRLSLIQDAGPAFSAMASALEAACRTIFIVGWDLDSRTVLRADASDARARTLLPLLRGCLDRHPELEIFILVWDFSFIYAFEREPRPRSQFGQVHPRLHFALDSDHGSGGSHHQKVVVIDDAVAFVGGIDLTLHRWDTPEHRPVDPRRVDGNNVLYGPFHDVHAAVSGPAARALGALARLRWCADRRRPPPPAAVEFETPSATDPAQAWPAELAVDATNIEVALARTSVVPGQLPIKEIEAVTLAAIAAAERWIYAENQYLTSGVVVRALGRRLSSPTGPEVIVVLPEAESGWMEQSSMGVLRDEALGLLREADRHGRLRLLAPTVTLPAVDVGAGDGGHATPTTTRVAVHAKVLVVDDRLVKVGSANFSNRSMGLDSECDLMVEARDPASAAFVASVRDRLLGEHLGVPAAELASRLAGHGSLCRIVDEQPTLGVRRLVPIPSKGKAPFDFTVLDGAMVDPPEPWNADLLLGRAVPVPLRRRLARRWRRPAVLAAAAIASALVVRVRGQHPGQAHAAMIYVAAWLARHPAGSFAAALAYAAGGALCVPVTLMATATLTVFGMWPGVAIAWVGGLTGAMLSHAIGGRLGPRALAWLPDRIGARPRQFLLRRAFWGTVVIRLMPVGNFGVLNLVAGAIKIPRRSFLFGNMVGLLPGLLGLGIVVDRVLALVRRPSVANSLVIVALVGLLMLLGFFVKRRVGSSAGRREFGATARARPPSDSRTPTGPR